MHGGAVMALGDTLGGNDRRHQPAEGRPHRHDRKQDQLLCRHPEGDTARAICTPLHRGRTTLVLETRITRGDGKLAAIVTQTQLIFDKGE